MEATKSAVTSIGTRPFLRSKAAVALAAAATVTVGAVVFQYQSSKFNQKEADQQRRKAPMYVSVERSGGGV